MFEIWYLRFILNYPTHIHDQVTPKLELTLQNQYGFSKWDTKGNVSAKTLTLLLGGGEGWGVEGETERALWTPP